MFKGLAWAAVLLALLSFNIYAEEEEEVGDDDNRTKTPPELSVIDTDGDGQISLEEFNAYRGTTEDDEEEEEESDEGGLSAFASFDKDRDGFVTEEELNAHAKYSNPGNGTGELLNREDDVEGVATSRGKGNSNSNKGSSSSSNSGNSNKGGGNRGGGNSNKGGKGKDK